MFTKTFAVATLAAVASAQLPPLARRDFVIEARQTASVDAACQTAISSVLPLYSEIPTPPEDLLSITLPADPCETPSLTGTIAAEYSSYTEEVLVWYSSHSAELLSALADCTELASYANEVPVCSTYIASAKSSASEITSAAATETEKPEATTDSATGTGSAYASKTAAGTSASSVATAGATHETGFVAGVVGAVAVLGAVMAL